MQLCPAPNVRKGHLNQAWRNIPSKKNSHASAVQMSACPVAQEKPTISKAPETSEWTSRAVSPKVGTRNKTQSDPARHAVTCFSANVLLYIYQHTSPVLERRSPTLKLRHVDDKKATTGCGTNVFLCLELSMDTCAIGTKYSPNSPIWMEHIQP